MKYALAIAAALMLSIPCAAFAEGEEDCQSQEKLVSFGDGNTVTQACLDEGATMVETVEDTSSEGVEDPGNYD